MVSNYLLKHLRHYALKFKNSHIISIKFYSREREIKLLDHKKGLGNRHWNFIFLEISEE